ncbi:MAG: hypothetical protein U0414_26135 [Polyangiaceae bacterium]
MIRGAPSPWPRAVLAALALGHAACDDAAVTPPAPTTARMDFASTEFYGSPFPSDARLRADGTVDLSTFPRPAFPNLVTTVVDMVDGHARGFGTTSSIYFALSAPLGKEAKLPDFAASVAATSPVQLIDADPGSASFGERVPITVNFVADGGPYGAPNLVGIVPLQGLPLHPKTLYAALLTSDLVDASGKPLAPSPAFEELSKGGSPKGMSDAARASFDKALTSLRDAGALPANTVAMTAFTTGDPTAEFDAVVAAALAAPTPTPKSAFTQAEVFDDYCVYQTTIEMPEYQEGKPPYSSGGGDWVFDASGKPVLDRLEEANFVVTIPRRAMPASGYPVVVLSRTGAGGERPLVDRGPHATAQGPSIAPGTGPALTYARAGFAGSSIDGPHGGLRNVTHDDEQFLVFNIGNPRALRDNVRQSALELVLQAHILEGVTIDVSACPGATAPGNVARLDPATMAIMGHSMGATISPLALSSEPRFKAGLLSGAGGSWIENVMFKLHPLEVKGFAELLVGYSGTPYSMTVYDPALSMFQWSLEGADPPVFDARVVRHATGAPKHVLMMQGIVDHYILPPIANATSLSMGLDLAGDALDAKTAEVAEMEPIESVIGFGEGHAIPFPVSLNVTTPSGAKVTALVTQFPEDGIEDGHEVVFQTEAPKHAYRCFLEGLAKGAPLVPKPAGALDPCE